MNNSFNIGDIVYSTRLSCGVSKFDYGFVTNNNFFIDGYECCTVLVYDNSDKYNVAKYGNYYIEKDALVKRADCKLTKKQLSLLKKISKFKCDINFPGFTSYHERLLNIISGAPIGKVVFEGDFDYLNLYLKETYNSKYYI